MQKISLILFNLDQFSIHGNTGWHRKIVRLVAINGEVLLVLVVPRCIQLAFLMFPILTANTLSSPSVLEIYGTLMAMLLSDSIMQHGSFKF
jgi:hypothetical protein